MSRLLLPNPALDAAILLDEAGIETGMFGEIRLKSAYSPVFERRGNALVPVALAATLQPMLRGRRLALRTVLAELGAADRALVERIATELHLRNRHNVSVGHLDLQLPWTGPWAAAAGWQPGHDGAEEREALEVDPNRLVWQFGPEHDDAAVSDACAVLRRIGCRIALQGFGVRPEMLRSIELLRPEIVCLDGAWFRRLASAPAAVLLFIALVERLKRTGTQVMVAGIETATQLRVALEAEPDLFQGAHLARPALAGSPFDAEARPICDLLQERGVVVPLFG